MMSMFVGENIGWIEEGKMSEFSCHFSEMPNNRALDLLQYVRLKRRAPKCGAAVKQVWTMENRAH